MKDFDRSKVRSTALFYCEAEKEWNPPEQVLDSGEPLFHVETYFCSIPWERLVPNLKYILPTAIVRRETNDPQLTIRVTETDPYFQTERTSCENPNQATVSDDSEGSEATS